MRTDPRRADWSVLPGSVRAADTDVPADPSGIAPTHVLPDGPATAPTLFAPSGFGTYALLGASLGVDGLKGRRTACLGVEAEPHVGANDNLGGVPGYDGGIVHARGLPVGLDEADLARGGHRRQFVSGGV